MSRIRNIRFPRTSARLILTRSRVPKGPGRTASRAIGGRVTLPLRDVLAAILVALILGSNFVAIKIGLNELPPLWLTGMRFLFAAVPAIFFMRPPKTSVAVTIGFGMSLGVVQFGLLFVAIGLGMPAGLSSLVIQMQVFFTIALAFWFFGERPTRLQVLGAVIATGGVVLIGIWKAQGAALLPLLLVVGAAMAWATANMFVKRAGRIDMLALMAWSSLPAALMLFALSLSIDGYDAVTTSLARATWRTAGAVAYLAYPTTLLAIAMWNDLLSRHSAATVTPFALLVPVAGIASTSIFLGERTDNIEIIGAVLVFAGLSLNVSGNGRRTVAAGDATMSRS